MQTTLQGVSRVTAHAAPGTFARSVAWGTVGGLAGTLAMDLVLMAALFAAGLPALASFSIVGDTVARFLSILGIDTAGGAPLGVATLHVVGPLFGTVFGAAMTQVRALRVDTRKKCIVFAILYVEIVSQPILATTPILLKMTTPVTLLWYGSSFVLHMIMGAVLGLVMSYGLRLGTAANRR
jgi:hypothetical protein